MSTFSSLNLLTHLVLIYTYFFYSIVIHGAIYNIQLYADW